jgi:hypothetical protein
MAMELTQPVGLAYACTKESSFGETELATCKLGRDAGEFVFVSWLLSVTANSRI